MNFALAKDKSVLSIHLKETVLPVGLEFSLSDMQAVFRDDYARDAYREKVKLALNDLLPQQTLKIPGYEIGQLLERQHEITRYAANHIALQREVMILVLNSATDHEPEIKDAFLLEAQALAAVDQLTVISVFDSGIVDGEHYMVTQYSEGTSLQHMIEMTHFIEEYQSVSSITPLQILGLIRDIAIILNLVDRGLIRLDTIDSSNLLVRQDGSVQLTGLGYLLNAINRTRFRNVKTYGRYFSPEESEGEPATPTSRVYSLGRIYMEIVSGVLPVKPFLLRSELQERITFLPADHQDLLSRMLTPEQGRIASCFDVIKAIDTMEPGLYQENYAKDSMELDVVRSFLSTNFINLRGRLENAVASIAEANTVSSEPLKQIADCLFSAGLFSGYLDFFNQHLDALGTGRGKAMLCHSVLGAFDQSLELMHGGDAAPDSFRLGEEVILLCKMGELVRAEQILNDFHFQLKKASNLDHGFPDVFYLYAVGETGAAKRLHEQLCSSPSDWGYSSRFQLWGELLGGDLDEIQNKLDYLLQTQTSPSPAQTLHCDLRRIAPTGLMSELGGTARYQSILKRLGIDDTFKAEALERVNSISGVTGIVVGLE